MNRAQLLPWPILAGVVLISLQVHALAADPLVDSWYTARSGRYARNYTTDANKAAGNAVATWSNGTFTQALPAYCGVQEIYSSAGWIYFRSTGLGSHVMGPWYLNAAHTQNFPNWPLNRKAFYRLPRVPAVPATKTLTGLGAIGYFVDGVAMFDCRDGFVWTGAGESGMGTGYWRRDAYINEGVTFDPGYAHQPQDGTHHYHAQPIALRYLLGDHVDFHPATKAYTESTGPVTRHSPILGWVRDGFPVYGPYGFASASNSAGGVRRMLSGYQLRNGARGTDTLATSGRNTIPSWAVRFYNVSASQAGPAVSATYPLGRYLEDNAYLGDLGYRQGVDFDLDEHNGRWCVTPDYPLGTYAYFTTIASDGTPVFPYTIGAAFHGTPSGGAVTTLAESVTTNFVGGTNLPSKLAAPGLGGGNVTLTWSAVEGGTYRVESSGTFASWVTNAANVAATQDTGAFVDSYSAGPRFYRVARTTVAAFDPVVIRPVP